MRVCTFDRVSFRQVPCRFVFRQGKKKTALVYFSWRFFVSQGSQPRREKSEGRWVE